MNTIDDLLRLLRLDGREELANDIAILRYKATMWDKYQDEGRIEQSRLNTLEIMADLDPENLAQLAAEGGDGADSILNPHAHDDFPNLATEFEPTKDASGHIYSGHSEEDVPGTARKGEN